VDHYVSGLHRAHQVVAGCGSASTGCSRGVEICADILAPSYFHPYVLDWFLLPPVPWLILEALICGGCKNLLQAASVSWLETWHADPEPEALGGIAALGRIRCLRDFRLRHTEAESQGIRVRFQCEPDGRLDESAVCFGQAHVLGVPRIDQRVYQNPIELAQPSQQHGKRAVVVRVPWRPAARTAATAFHGQAEMVAVSFDQVLRVQDAAIVISQLHESKTPIEKP
jgi:hypothetical protein